MGCVHRVAGFAAGKPFTTLRPPSESGLVLTSALLVSAAFGTGTWEQPTGLEEASCRAALMF